MSNPTRPSSRRPKPSRLAVEPLEDRLPLTAATGVTPPPSAGSTQTAALVADGTTAPEEILLASATNKAGPTSTAAPADAAGTSPKGGKGTAQKDGKGTTDKDGKGTGGESGEAAPGTKDGTAPADAGTAKPASGQSQGPAADGSGRSEAAGTDHTTTEGDTSGAARGAEDGGARTPAAGRSDAHDARVLANAAVPPYLGLADVARSVPAPHVVRPPAVWPLPVPNWPRLDAPPPGAVSRLDVRLLAPEWSAPTPAGQADTPGAPGKTIAEDRTGPGSAGEPLPTEVDPPPVFWDVLPVPGGLLPLNLRAWERCAEDLFGRLDDLGEGADDASPWSTLAPWGAALGVMAAAALELTRRQLNRQGPAPAGPGRRGLAWRWRQDVTEQS